MHQSALGCMVSLQEPFLLVLSQLLVAQWPLVAYCWFMDNSKIVSLYSKRSEFVTKVISLCLECKVVYIDFS